MAKGLAEEQEPGPSGPRTERGTGFLEAPHMAEGHPFPHLRLSHRTHGALSGLGGVGGGHHHIDLPRFRGPGLAQQPSEPAWDRLVDLFAVVSKVEGFYPPTRIRLWLEGPNAPGPLNGSGAHA